MKKKLIKKRRFTPKIDKAFNSMKAYSHYFNKADQAQRLCSFFTSVFKIKKVKIIFSDSNYKNYYAVAKMLDREIIFYKDKRGRSVGILLHELAHFVSGEKLHNYQFRKAQKKLLNYYEKEM